ncbi:glycoside hydrolase family 130 protein [Adhaeribacter pallidiroseus]|uniref:Beta-1,4-mannooligosaccharide phosphorylase n=1 Tax=Adhaeribacter pallidiroseus TaxID=2072847 RepID=A0A369QPT9_9BACT|nr:glycoside hydrolase family 130 protein [Adhaeribacter pallidiroseus]RDC65685.1 Beta-1,4-mannooligosaccharide phosphorylase [Adhaeribacter pallidiroseus]
MPTVRCLYFLNFLLFLFVSCNQQSTKQTEADTKSGSTESSSQANQEVTKTEAWTLGPFRKEDALNPILGPDSTTKFYDPIRRDSVKWEEKDVFNPAAVMRNGQVHLLYRAEDKIGKFAGTSRIGLAISQDGLHFKRMPNPVLYPDNDFMKKYEWEGGCEDPRVVETLEGTYVMTYTTYDGKTARLCVATSKDLQTWKKHGLAFGKAYNGKYKDIWSKSGAIVCQRQGSQIVANKINGKYWMYWGDTDMFMATSDNLLDWTPLEENNKLAVAFGPRPGQFDSRLVEPGPPAMITEAGILLIYNSMNLDKGGTAALPAGTYTAGQILLDPKVPTKVLQRTANYFMKPEKEYEITGQVGNVCFLEGLVFLNNKWFLYYGTADSKIAVATHSAN